MGKVKALGIFLSDVKESDRVRTHIDVVAHSVLSLWMCCGGPGFSKKRHCTYQLNRTDILLQQ